MAISWTFALSPSTGAPYAKREGRLYLALLNSCISSARIESALRISRRAYSVRAMANTQPNAGCFASRRRSAEQVESETTAAGRPPARH